MQYHVYIVTNKPNGVLYTGVTNDLIRRIWEHKEGVAEGFTKKYQLKQLVYYEQTDNVESAISKEKAMKKWNREWKLKRINEINPNWDDLYPSLL